MSEGLKEQATKEKAVQRSWLSRNFDIAWAAVQDNVGWSDGHEQERVRQEQVRQEQERIRQEQEALEQEQSRQEQERIRQEQERQERVRQEKERTRQEKEQERHELEQKNQQMFGTEEGRQKLKADPILAAQVLTAVDPEWLKTIDLKAIFGESKDDVLSGAVLAISKRKPIDSGGEWIPQKDLALISALGPQIPPEKWNDTVSRKRGLGPRVCQALWSKGCYDEICQLIDHGVDTSLAARADGPGGSGVYMGFVQPIQHVASNYVRDIASIEAGGTLPPGRAAEAQGAKKIFDNLGDNTLMLTKWSEVQKSEMIDEFKKNPGTIWGFESIRLPYVQAAHETEHGAQPLRMLELWESVGEVTRNPSEYQKLLDDPEIAIENKDRETAIDKLVKVGVDKIRTALSNPLNKWKYADVEKNQETFIANFERDVRAFLTEFVAQMPKGTFAPKADAAGIIGTSLMGGLACKAGLWWAKNENKPVYYCLDGINMDEATDYKTMKNKAIQAYLDAGGKSQSATQAHQEVITLVEVREILKNWHELKDNKGNDIVKFVLKGKILKGEELEQAVKDWRANMADSNEQAGRSPAPPRATFTKELNAIDADLINKLEVGPEGDKDARDIVRKSGYLLKVAKTRPETVLKYILSKCGVLIKYGLIPEALPKAAAELVMAEQSEMMDKRVKLLLLIKECNKNFHEPLQAAFVRLPLFRRGEQI